MRQLTKQPRALRVTFVNQTQDDTYPEVTRLQGREVLPGPPASVGSCNTEHLQDRLTSLISRSSQKLSRVLSCLAPEGKALPLLMQVPSCSDQAAGRCFKLHTGNHLANPQCDVTQPFPTYRRNKITWSPHLALHHALTHSCHKLSAKTPLPNKPLTWPNLEISQLFLRDIDFVIVPMTLQALKIHTNTQGHSILQLRNF